MNRNSFSVCFAVALLFILSSITASAQQPRVVPPNNNIVGAESIKIGKSYSVPDIGAATNEGGEPTSACRFGTVIPHSVWFTFSLPEFSRIYLSAFGSRLVASTGHEIDTVLAVYEKTGGVFTERACAIHDSDTPFSQIVFLANAGVTYYIAAGARFDQVYAPESTLKLTTRMLRTTIIMPNSSFEAAVNDTDWVLKNEDTDQVVCSDAAYPALDGPCAFRFTGTPDVTTKLTQTIPFPTDFVPRKNGFVSSLFFFRVMDTPALGTAKVKFTIYYSDGTPPTIHKADLTGTAAMNSYQARLFWHDLKSSKVASIKFDVKFASPTGTLLIDSVFFTYQADVLTRAGGLLPVPPAVGPWQ